MLQLGQRALRFEEYLLRRAWGVYYAVWAFTFLMFFSIPSVVYVISPSLASSPYPYFLGYGLAGGLGSWATYVNFQRVYRTTRLRRALSGTKRVSRRLRFLALVLIWVSPFLLFFVPYQILGFRGLSMGYLVLIYVAAWIYISLRRSFTSFPLEGVFAIASFTSACILSVYSVLEAQYFVLQTTWLVTTIVWTFCALYALYRAPEMAVYEE